MTKIEIYTIIYSLTLAIRLGARMAIMTLGVKEEQPSADDRFWYVVVEILVATPILGRVFGWW